MSGERSDLDDLRRALEAFGTDHAPDLVAEAREDALERARSILTTEMTRALLDGAEPYLTDRPPTPRRSPAPARPASTDREPVRSTYAGADAPPADGTATAVYTYGIASAEDAAELQEALETIAGVGSGSPPFTIVHKSLVAIASEVPLAEFGEEPLRENLNDVEWLEHAARGHERVLEAAREAATVVPLRLCTIYRGDGPVRIMLDREHLVFLDALHRLAGKTEWGVKLLAEPGALERALAADAGDDAGEASPGVAYMRGRSRETREREETDHMADAWAVEAHERLADRAVEALLNPLQNPEVSGHVGDMILNGVYLVADAGLEAFTDEVQDLTARFEDRGVTVELTGPWPPYNFVKGSIEAAR